MGAFNRESRPGKTPPRLIIDFLDYDPRYRGSSPRDSGSILADPAPQFKGFPIKRTGPLDCHHSLRRKDSQTVCPTGNTQTFNGSEKWTVASYCTSCKQHFTVTADYNDSKRPCNLQDQENPLHHLITTRFENGREYAARSQSEGTFDEFENVQEFYRFECSAECCNLRVEIKIGPPRLSPEYLLPLLDSVKVATRGQREIEDNPERYVGLSHVRPLQALGYLRTYIWDAKQSSETSKPLRNIARRNKKYRLAFGDECEDLFEYLGFTSHEEVSDKDDGEGEISYFWRPPLIQGRNTKFFDDVLAEIENKMQDRPAAEQHAGNIIVNLRPQPALPDIERSLGCFDYPKRSRNIDLTKPEHPYYASLGAVDSLTDAFLGWAYERQCECDPLNRPYYLDCLMDLARGRKSPDLDTRVAIAVSAGEVGLKAIEGAYIFFGLDPSTKEGDEHIIGLYKSRIESAPRQKDDAKTQLLILARSRKSEKLEELANDNTITYEEALRFFGVTASTDADVIAAQATALALDGDKNKVVLALRVIAAQRSDYSLQVVISQLDDSGEPLLDVTEAYRRLQIQERSAPDSTVFAFYASLSNGASVGSKESFAQALRAIAHSRQSHFLFRKLEDPNAEVKPEEVDLSQPVGLSNIGNTCYLNSLLQYFYTIKPVRDVVLNIGEYRLPLNDEEIRKRRAGGRQNTRIEIAKGQRFTEELSDLFRNLKTAPSRAIRPTVELADLSFFNEEVEETVRRASIASPNGPPKVFFGPEGPPPPIPLRPAQEPIAEDVEMNDRSAGKDLETASETSESTLVDLDPLLSPGNTGTGEFDAVPKKLGDTQEEDDAVMINGANFGLDAMISSPPDKPPPVPPRNRNGLSISTSRNKTSVPDDNRWLVGTQQDVDEVIRNTTWRMMCAIKPISTDPKTGEQSDKIRDTFYGDTATYLEKATKVERKVESFSSLLVYASQKKAIDIYEAIDHTLDMQRVEVDKTIVPQYSSIAKLPPILQIQINRTIFDTVKKQSVKVKGAVNFPETIYLDRYMDSPDPNSVLMRRRRQGWEWKAELQALEARLEALQNTTESKQTDVLPANRTNEPACLNVAEALNDTKDLIAYLQDTSIPDLDISPDLPSLLEERISEIGIELENIHKQIDLLKRNLAEQFTDMRQYEYKLQAVFIHRGTAGAGHYWIYIYDFKNDIWREYNDERVEVVSNRKRIFDAQFAEGATPYYLVYVRASDRDDLVDPVCRDPVAEELPVDAVMQDDNGWHNVTGIEEDEGIVMDDEDENVSHVEHARPQPLRPKMQMREREEKLDGKFAQVETDANGRPW